MHDHKEMSEEKKEKLTAKLKELGIDENKIDERLMWSFKKVSFGLMKLRLVLDDKGIDEAQSRKTRQVKLQSARLYIPPKVLMSLMAYQN